MRITLIAAAFAACVIAVPALAQVNVPAVSSTVSGQATTAATDATRRQMEIEAAKRAEAEAAKQAEAGKAGTQGGVPRPPEVPGKAVGPSSGR